MAAIKSLVRHLGNIAREDTETQEYDDIKYKEDYKTLNQGQNRRKKSH